MVCRFLDRRVAPILASLFAVLSACATLEEVVPGCGNHVVEDNEDCDGASGKTLCGEQDTPHQCRFIWDDTHDCPAGYVASPDKRCRKGSGNLIFSATVEISGRDPQIADFGGDGTVELGMTELDAPVLALYTVNAAVAERFAALPSFGVVALGEVSDDSATDIVLGTPPASNNVCADGPVQGTEPAGGSKTEAGLSVLRSTSDAFSLKVYANSTLGEAVRFAAVPFWLFGDCEVFDLEVLTRLAIVGDSLEICAVDDCDDTKTTIANVDPTTKLAIDANDAYAVVSSQGQGSLLYIPREGFTGLDDAFANPDVLTTPSGVTVEAGVALVDLDSDGLDDLVVLGREPADNFALYVLPGQAPDVGDDYPSLAGTVLQRWLEIPGWIPGDGGANVFETADFNDDSVPDFFLGDRLLISTGVVAVEPFDSLDTYYRTECVLGQDFSNVGPSCKGYAPGAVGDVDGDGLDDLVSVGLDDLGSETIQLLL
ncbi:MAG: hypothetical protein JNK04_01320, partial [Myxococcales bacterium]|nr:hypothetical protein [Myxococcales bacterium]